MKKISSLIALFICSIASAQVARQTTVPADLSFFVYVEQAGVLPINSKKVFYIKDDLGINFLTPRIYFDSLFTTTASRGSRYLQVNPTTKKLGFTPEDSLYTQWNNIVSKPSFSIVATSGSYSDLSGKPTIPTNTNQLTNGSGFISSISSADVLAAIGYSPVNTTTTITINGTSQNLATNRTWTVGTLVANDTISLSSRIDNKLTAPSGTTAQYVRGNATLATFPTVLSSFTNDAGFLTSEVDGSITNEIELPSQTSNSGKVLGTNGTSPSWVSVSTGTVTSVALSVPAAFNISGSPITSSGTLAIAGAGTSSQFVKGDGSLGTSRVLSVSNGISHSIVTTAASANGFQISASKDVFVHYSVKIACSVQIGVVTNVEGYIVLETCATNSSTAGDWSEAGRVSNGVNIGVALALSSVTTETLQLGGVIPAGYHARLRSVNVQGTPTYTYITGQEVQF